MTEPTDGTGAGRAGTRPGAGLERRTRPAAALPLPLAAAHAEEGHPLALRPESRPGRPGQHHRAQRFSFFSLHFLDP